MEFLREHQLNIMLFMSGVCFVLAILTLMPKFMPRRRRVILCLLEFSSMLLLLFDRFAYQFRGDPSEFGGAVVRISNGLVYLLTLLIPVLVAHFLREIFRSEEGFEKALRRLVFCDSLFVAGLILITISQFTGLYYSFDAQNNYVRGPGFIFSYIIPLMIIVIQESLIIQFRNKLTIGFRIVLLVSIILPVIAAVVQFFAYGLSLLNMTMIIVSIIFYVYSICSLGEKVDQARVREIEFYKKAQEQEAELFEEVTSALVYAIDAKDQYTRGHSLRVARISREIARKAGFSREECSQVYFAALLHDVGKIGIRYEVLNKPERLTDEEYDQIKLHTIFGYQILSGIKRIPFLSIAAHYHHERYDGSGYPEGLSGDDIPVIARIVAVADAYDTMRSNRSYRSALPIEVARQEIANGSGKQFDAKYAEIMLQLIDSNSPALRSDQAKPEDKQGPDAIKSDPAMK